MPSIIDIVCGPWAIMPDRLIEIQGIYATHLRGEKISIPDVEAKLGRKLDNRYESFQVQDGVAIIPLQGAIAKKMNLFSQISGGASAELVKRDIEQALADPKIKGIILDVDSPGGTVDGTAEVADFIYNSRGSKPILAYSDGMIASAAYWIASACDSIHISSDTNTIGSIGVVAAHRDYSKAEERMGVKTTEITAGKYKRIASQHEPLSDEGRADIQAKLDYLYTAFVNDVARNRGTSVETVLSDMADGRVFIGKQNIENGLVDGVATLDDLIDTITSGQAQPGRKPQPQQKQKKRPAGAAADNQTIEEKIMNKEQLKAQHPELYDALISEGREQAAAENGAKVTEAVTAEQARVVAMVSAAFGEESGTKFGAVVGKGLSADDIKTLGISFSGQSAADDAESRKEILAALKEGNKPLGKTAGEEAEKDFEVLVTEHQKANSCGRTAALQAVAASHPKEHAAYLKKFEKAE